MTMPDIGVPLSRNASEEHVTFVDHLRPAAVVARRGGGLLTFEGLAEARGLTQPGA
ncbi:hypothetical protein [Nocardia terpenica]|uniref:Uncharacterized protein n=1 Tax=Nocardia terpenica TaxID=455432 RepID=A0A6G9Z4H9_9NOCA|nr:hypothetical protein [Nocardia terpenica]QIS20374.1 hypothetical protein F6W96_20810 [Nocardia terpenica]